MRLHVCNIIQATVVAFLLTAVAVAQAETWSLNLKQLEPRDSSKGSSDRMDYIYRTTRPQHFFFQMVLDGKGGVRSVGNKQHVAAFKKIVKKEPKYTCKRPFKRVAKLGTQEFAFVLDASTPTPKAKDEKPQKNIDKAKTKSKDAKSEEKLTKAKSPLAMPAYDRLYFDFNHNGDLTDDRVVTGKVKTRKFGTGESHAQISFPRLDVTIDADGTPVESSIFLSGYANSSSNYGYVNVRINAGAYREGEIMVEGKKRHVVLIDFNSNGRFDNEMKVHKNVRGGRGQIYPKHGDVLLVDPKQSQGGSPYDVTSADYRHNVSKVVNIDGRFYDLKITPAGDKLTLEASSVATGNVTNPNDGFSALIYSDNIFLKISGNKDTPTPVPEGKWKLLTYTINLTEAPKPVEPSKKDDKKAEKETLSLGILAGAFKAVFNSTVRVPSRPRNSMVSARATNDYKVVKVVKGKTVELPFGPPYKPLVTARNYGNPKKKQVHLQMSLVGSAGEICSNMRVRDGRPSKPEFTITDPKGEVVQKDSFEYG